MTMLMFLLLVTLLPADSFAKEQMFGPSEWTQYRMLSDKNAVFNNGSDPLEYTEFETANEIRTTPVIVNNNLFIGNHETGELFAFDVNTGEELWKNKAPNWIHSEMIYHDEMVYVGYGNRFFQDNGVRGTGDNGILALNAETGDIEWSFETEGEVMPTPAYYKEHIYITTGDRHLYKLNASNGELEHTEEIGHTISMSSPNITEDTLYVGGSGPTPYTFSAYDLQKDEILWQTEFPDVTSGLDDVPPAVKDDLVVTTAVEGGSKNPEQKLFAMDTKTGEIIWEESFGKGEFVDNNKSGAPMIYDDKVFVGSPITKTFYAYDLKSGEKVWEFEDEVMKAPPVAQDGIVYFSNTKGMVYALDTETGEQLGEIELNGVLAPGGPIIINDTLIVSSQDSNVYAVPLTDIVEDLDSYQKDANNSSIYYILIGGLLIGLILLVLFALKKRRKN